ncbi:glycosyltransferase family 2 protein [Ekhidna sp.]
MKPFFSVIITSYNREATIERSVASVLNQSFKDFELLLIDDGSTDSTSSLVKRFSSKKIKYFYKDNEERNIARNFGIDKSSGEFIIFLDSDDEFLPNHLSNYKNTIESYNEGIFVSHHQLNSYGQISEKKIDELNPKKLIFSNPIVVGGICIERTLFNKDLRFLNSKDSVVGEDQYLWMRLFSRYSFRICNFSTVVIHEDQSRSLRNIDVEKLVRGQSEIIDSLSRDAHFLDAFGRHFKAFKSNSTYFIGLNYVGINGVKATSYLLKGFKMCPNSIFKKVFWAIVKNIVLKRKYYA